MSPLRAVLYTIGVILVSVLIPIIGGLAGLVAGGLMIDSARRKRAVRSVVSQLPLCSIAEAPHGAIVRVSGRVTTKASVRSPISGQEVVYAVLHGRARLPTAEEDEGWRELTAVLGDGLEIQDDTGRAVVDLRAEQVTPESRHLTKHDERKHGRKAAVRAALKLEDDSLLQAEEFAILPGDVVDLVGWVQKIEMTPSDRHAGYRTVGQEPRITISWPPIEEIPMLVTNMASEPTDETGGYSVLRLVLGGLYLVIAVAGGAASLWLVLS